MKSHVFLSSLGVTSAAVLIGQFAVGGGKGGDGQGIFDIHACRVGGVAQSVVQSGSIGTFPDGTVAVSYETFLANQGNEEIPWYASSDVDHPIIAQNMYRITPDGRLEQIGLAWLKHTWFALQQGGCATCFSCNCSGVRLGVGCADTYSSGHNADQGDLGPRWEITPNEHRWMDGRTWAGSRFQTGPGHSNTVQRRLRVRMGDLDDQGGGTQYFYECVMYMLRDYDQPEYDDLQEHPDRMFNNAAHRKASVTHNGGSSFSYSNLTGSTQGPLIQAWGTVRDRATPTTEGVVYVSSRAVDIGGGLHRYEYAVMNYSFDLDIDSLSIPVGAANVTNIGFHAPRDGYWTDATTFVNESPYDVANWENQVSGGAITFNAPTPEGGTEPNTIRFSTVYTFWFTADVPPAQQNQAITLSPYEQGNVTELTAAITAPAPNRQPAGLTDIATTWGTHMGGNLASVQTSDDVRYTVNSAIGFLATEPNVTEVTVGATSPFATGSALQATVESRLNTPGGTRRVKLRNFDTNSLATIDTYSIGTAEITEVTSVGGGIAQYVRDSDNRIELVNRTSVMATFVVNGFLDRYDWIDIQVDE